MHLQFACWIIESANVTANTKSTFGVWWCFTFGRPRAVRGYANATTLLNGTTELPRRRRNTATIRVMLIGSVPPCILGIIRPFLLFLAFCQQLPHWGAPHGLVGQVAKKCCGWIFLRTIVDWVRYAAGCHLWEICNYERFPISSICNYEIPH